MNREQVQDKMGQILDMNHEGELQITLDGEYRLGTRFNDCAISQNVLKIQTELCLTARLGQKKASVRMNSINDNDAIKCAIDQVFETCRHMPDDEETMPALGHVLKGPEYAFSDISEALQIEAIAQSAAAACKAGESANIDLAGLLSLSKNFSTYADSVGGYAYERYHRTDYHVTASGASGSGWAELKGTTLNQEPVQVATRRAIDKCEKAQKPKTYNPRSSTVILEPQAVGDLMAMAFWYGFDQRAKDEGRSALADFSDSLGKLSLYSEPSNSIFPTVSFTSEGQALKKNSWLDEGKLQPLITSRYWAKNKNCAVRPSPNNLILDGDGDSIEELIKNTEDAILVTRFWYVRSTDARTLSFTGMTRDGTYRIENGVVTYPVFDMRWNDSVLRILQNIVASGVPTATGDFLAMVMPALKIEGFKFTSVSG